MITVHPYVGNTISEEHSSVPVADMIVLNYYDFMAIFLMAIASAAPKSFTKAKPCGTLPYGRG